MNPILEAKGHPKDFLERIFVDEYWRSIRDPKDRKGEGISAIRTSQGFALQCRRPHGAFQRKTEFSKVGIHSTVENIELSQHEKPSSPWKIFVLFLVIYSSSVIFII